ncbi:MAG TPA: HlyD family efflux transporter periplasmic adaptor subunit [Polyangiaceae bacterium]
MSSGQLEDVPAPTAMDLVRPSNSSRVLARLLVAALALIAVVLLLTPWQQSAPGAGRVVAYAPDERRQNLEAPIDGRVLRWFVREGSLVEQGDPIVGLTDNDPEILVRLRAERDAFTERLNAAKARAWSLESRIDALEASRISGIAAAESRIRMANQRVIASDQALALAVATLNAAKLNIERQTSLAEEGLTSTRQLELTELEATRAQTEVERARVALVAAQSEQVALTSDRKKIENDASASINDARAAQAAAEAEVASASAELSRMEVRLARQSAQSVRAPRDGTVFRIVANGHAGEIVKAGDVLAVLVPDTNDRAVELWVSGNDMPLVSEGARARIQFEGWPAVQFTGWPSAAVGTFPGRVKFIDAHDDGAGQFRVVVVPEAGAAWPSASYLRQGVRTQGWIQLGRVSLGYELWRQFNGFPPSPSNEPELRKRDTKADATGGDT